MPLDDRIKRLIKEETDLLHEEIHALATRLAKAEDLLSVPEKRSAPRRGNEQTK